MKIQKILTYTQHQKARQHSDLHQVIKQKPKQQTKQQKAETAHRPPT
jgi:hypothetical protein